MSDLADLAMRTMQPFMGNLVARLVLDGAAIRSGCDLGTLQRDDLPGLMDSIDGSIHSFMPSQDKANACCNSLRVAFGITGPPVGSAPATVPAYGRRATDIEGPENAAEAAEGVGFLVPIGAEYDIVVARSKTKVLCAELGFPLSMQVKVATVVSELARNIVQYVGSGSIEIKRVEEPRNGIEIRALDKGNGIQDLDTILSGKYKSRTGMGMGLCGASKMMHEFNIDSRPGGGTSVVARMYAS